MKKSFIIFFGIAFLGITVLATSCYVNSTAPGAPYPNPDRPLASCGGNMRWVTLDEAVARVKEYGDKQWTGINSEMTKQIQAKSSSMVKPFVDSRFVTFSVDSIKKFICVVEQMVAANKCKKEGGSLIQPRDLGIRFYYATYPGLHADEPTGVTYKGRHSLLLVPTYLDTTGQYVEFFPAYIDKNDVPLSLSFIIGRTFQGMTASMPILMTGDKEAAKNQGTLCPPPSSCNAAILSMAGSKVDLAASPH